MATANKTQASAQILLNELDRLEKSGLLDTQNSQTQNLITAVEVLTLDNIRSKASFRDDPKRAIEDARYLLTQVVNDSRPVIQPGADPEKIAKVASSDAREREKANQYIQGKYREAFGGTPETAGMGLPTQGGYGGGYSKDKDSSPSISTRDVVDQRRLARSLWKQASFQAKRATIAAKGYVVSFGSSIGGAVAGAGEVAGDFLGVVGAVVGGLIATLLWVIATYLGLTLFLAFTILIINNSAYITPPGSPLEGSSGTVPGGSIESLYIGLTKTPNPPGPFENSEIPVTVTYTITVTAKRGPLTNISFENRCEVIKDGTKPPCEAPIPTEIPQVIDPGNPYTFQYTVTYHDKVITPEGEGSFRDSLAIDTFTVNADVGETTDLAQTSAAIQIGDPPSDCPNGWPIFPNSNETRLTSGQGPNGSWSHRGYEAVDVGAGTGHSITARHSGVVEKAGCSNNGCGASYGKVVRIKSFCNGITFDSLYGHNDSIFVKVGDVVTLGQQIALSGNTGNSTGAHLHYEFRPSDKSEGPISLPFAISMNPPFTPKTVTRNCQSPSVCLVIP